MRFTKKWRHLLWLWLWMGMGCMSSGISQGDVDVHKEHVPKTAHGEKSWPYFVSGPLKPWRELWDQKEYAAFLKSLEKKYTEPFEKTWLSDEEEDHHLKFMMAWAYEQTHQCDKAAQIFEHLAQKDERLKDYERALGAEAYYCMGDYAKSKAMANGVDEDSLMHAHALLYLGLSLVETQQCHRAIRILDLVLKSHSRLRPAAWWGQAKCLEKWHRWDEAALLYRRVIADQRDEHWAPKAKRALKNLEDLGKIEAFMEKTKPQKADPWKEARKAYEKHHSREAIQKFSRLRTRAKAQSQWCESTYYIGKAYSKLRKHPKALQYYEEVLKKCNDQKWFKSALYNAGRAAWNANKQQRALELFEQLAQTYPKDSLADDAYLYRARIYFELGKRQKALDLLKEQVNKYPYGDMVKDAHWLLFSEYYRTHHYSKAIRYYQTWKKTGFGEDDLYALGRIQYFVGRSWEKLGQIPKALETYQRLVFKQRLSYYALLSMSRMALLDPQKYRDLNAQLRPWNVEQKVQSLNLEKDMEWTQDPAYWRGMTLMGMGFLDWGRDELQRVQVSVESENLLEWYKISMNDRVGDYAKSHRWAQKKLAEFQGYPRVDQRYFWQLAYPRPYWNDVEHFGTEFQVSWALIYAIMREESGFRHRIKSWAGAYGLMQLMESTAQRWANELDGSKISVDDLYEAQTNLRLGIKFLSFLSQHFEEQPIYVIAAYNAGEKKVDAWKAERSNVEIDLWLEDCPYGQTRKYTKRVLQSYWRYEWLYKKDSALVQVLSSEFKP